MDQKLVVRKLWENIEECPQGSPPRPQIIKTDIK